MVFLVRNVHRSFCIGAFKVVARYLGTFPLTIIFGPLCSGASWLFKENFVENLPKLVKLKKLTNQRVLIVNQLKIFCQINQKFTDVFRYYLSEMSNYILLWIVQWTDGVQWSHLRFIEPVPQCQSDILRKLVSLAIFREIENILSSFCNSFSCFIVKLRRNNFSMTLQLATEMPTHSVMTWIVTATSSLSIRCRKYCVKRKFYLRTNWRLASSSCSSLYFFN